MSQPAYGITAAIMDARDVCQRIAGERYAEQVALARGYPHHCAEPRRA